MDQGGGARGLVAALALQALQRKAVQLFIEGVKQGAFRAWSAALPVGNQTRDLASRSHYTPLPRFWLM